MQGDWFPYAVAAAIAFAIGVGLGLLGGLADKRGASGQDVRKALPG
jgi:hypothetical protein